MRLQLLELLQRLLLKRRRLIQKPASLFKCLNSPMVRAQQIALFTMSARRIRCLYGLSLILLRVTGRCMLRRLPMENCMVRSVNFGKRMPIIFLHSFVFTKTMLYGKYLPRRKDLVQKKIRIAIYGNWAMIKRLLLLNRFRVLHVHQPFLTDRWSLFLKLKQSPRRCMLCVFIR